MKFQHINLFILFAVIALVSACNKEDGNDDTNASERESHSCNSTSIVDPRDNQEYQVIQIGEQKWFVENLRYAGSLNEANSNESWTSKGQNEQGAWCYYGDDPENNAAYGKLYNWFVVVNESICPPGWHIPSNAEWTQLVDFLGGTFAAGGKMKSFTGWDDPNEGATNESCFSGLPGGSRDENGNFANIGSIGYWWTSTQHGSNFAWDYSLANHNNVVGQNNNFKSYGLSCRCVED